MPNTVKEDWKRRVNAKLAAVIVVPLVLVSVWWAARNVGTSSVFGEVFQIDPGQLSSVTVNGNGKVTTYTEREDIENFVEYLRGFRYTEHVQLNGLIEPIGGIQFYDSSGHYICGLGLSQWAVLTEDNTLYKGNDETYFAEWFD